MSKRSIRIALTLVGAGVLAGGLPATAQASPAPVVAAVTAAPAPAAGPLAAAAAVEDHGLSMLGRWHYVSGPSGALDPGQDWLVDVTAAADGTLVGTIVTSSHTDGPCVVGGVLWRGITPSWLPGVWSGEQSLCNGTFVASTFNATESGGLAQRTSDGTTWRLEPAPPA